MREKLFTLLLFSILFFSQIEPVFSDEANQAPILIIISTVGSDSANGETLKKIINDSISPELKVKGFRAIIDNKNNLDNLFEKATEIGATYIIYNVYREESKSLIIDINSYRVSNGVKIYSISTDSKIDLDLDSSIRDVVLQLIDAINQDLEANPPQLIESEIESEVEPEVRDSQDRTIEKSEKKEEIFSHIGVSAGFSPFLTIGQATGYFTIGYAPEIHGEYRIKIPFGYLGLGIFSSLNYFTASGLLDSSENLLISMGPELRLGITALSIFELFLKINGGVTVFMLNRNNEGFKSTLIPFVSAGIGFKLNFVPLFGLYLSGNYIIYFENSLFITGFSPSIGVQFNF